MGALAAALAAAAARAADPEILTVQVRRTEVRDTPSFLGETVAQAAYGERLAALSNQAAWVCVRLPGTGGAGWVHRAALTRKTIVMGTGVAASSGEVALAGKGFNAAVEKEFRAAHKHISFAWVNLIEKQSASPSEIAAFLREGGLAADPGGSHAGRP
jgi:hypothetical protein